MNDFALWTFGCQALQLVVIVVGNFRANSGDSKVVNSHISFVADRRYGSFNIIFFVFYYRSYGYCVGRGRAIMGHFGLDSYHFQKFYEECEESPPLCILLSTVASSI